MGGSVDLDSFGDAAADEHAEKDNQDEDTLTKISPLAESTCRASDTSQQSNADSGCEHSSDESPDEGNSSDESSHDELYSRDTVPDPDLAREILQTWHFLPNGDDFDSDEEQPQPQRPESPFPYEPSEEFKEIEASAILWSEKLEQFLQNAHLHRLQYAEMKRRDLQRSEQTRVKKVEVTDKELPASRSKTSPSRHSSSLHDAKYIYHTCSTGQRSSTQRSDSIGKADIPKKKNIQFQLPAPPKEILELMEMAMEELLSDIAQLPRNRENAMKSQSVTDKYFPPAIYKGMRQWPDLEKGFDAIRSLECEAMPERLDPVIMMARIGSPEPDATEQDEITGQTSAPQQADVDETASVERPPRPLNFLIQAPTLLPPSQPPSTGSSLRGSPMHRAVDRILESDGYAAPNPSPALSNDPGETLGNLRLLTERLEVESGRVNSAGIVPQSRFATPEYWQENAALQRQYEEMHAEPSPITRGSVSHFSDDSSDVPPDGPPRLVHPRPLRPGEPTSPILQRTFHTPPFHGDTPPRSRTPNQLSSTPEVEAGRRKGSSKRRKRNKSEASGEDEQADALFRARWDSIWTRKGSGNDDDRKGSGGSSGAVAG